MALRERVRKYLNFDVARVLEEFLKIDSVIAEGGFCFLFGGLDRIDERRFRVDDLHAASAATAGGFNNDRVADLTSDFDNFGRIVRERAAGAGDAGHARFDHRFLRGDFISHQTDGFRSRADKDEAA